jgi:hypothetical protein
MRYLFFAILLLLAIIFFNNNNQQEQISVYDEVTGFGNNNPQGRVPILGEVTFDGKPLEKGEILFESVAGTTPMVATGSPIKNGLFSLPAEHGLIPDQTYSVQFRSIELIPDTQEESDRQKKTDKRLDMAEIKTRDIIPRKYGVDSKETVTATKKSPNMFQFDLTSGTDK